ncbi:tyrosyl-tRNA synthetase, partial [Haematococcus lacustris]
QMLTFLPLEEVEAVAAAMGQTGYVPNTAQRRLAEEVTRFVHGEEGLAQALRATEALRPGAETALDAASLAAVAGDVPSVALQRAEVQGMALVDLLLLTRLQPSKGAARKLIAGGGVYLNNVKVADVAAVVRAEDMIEGRVLLLAAGKKNKLLVNLT